MKPNSKPFYFTNKQENPFCMSRFEFEDNNEDNRWKRPYEYYRIYPILNKESQKKLLVYMRKNNHPVDIIKECARLLEEENTQK